MTYQKNTKCRICKVENLIKFLDLGEQPLANSFLKSESEFASERKFPLTVCFCPECNLVQLGDIVAKEELFSNYIYFSSGMPKLSDHFKLYAQGLMQRFLKPGDLVLEIASNDGILLKHFQEKGFRVLGIDPAENVVKIALGLGVETMVDFFSEKLAKNLAQERGKAKGAISIAARRCRAP